MQNVLPKIALLHVLPSITLLLVGWIWREAHLPGESPPASRPPFS